MVVDVSDEDKADCLERIKKLTIRIRHCSHKVKKESTGRC